MHEVWVGHMVIPDVRLPLNAKPLDTLKSRSAVLDLKGAMYMLIQSFDARGQRVRHNKNSEEWLNHIDGPQQPTGCGF